MWQTSCPSSTSRNESARPLGRLVLRMHAPEHPSHDGAIAIYAADHEVRHRIGSALALSEYEIFDCVGPVEELTAGRHADLRALVLATSLERLGHEDRVVRLRAHLGSLRLVVVATGPYNPTAWKVVRSGVEGLVRESELELTLRPTVEAVLADQLCIPRAMRQALAEPVFSTREKQVL